MSTTEQQLPEGYAVIQAADGSWRWESILAPECHSACGFTTEAEAFTHCRVSNDMGTDDWR